MAMQSEPEMAFISRESISSKNSELNEGALLELENSAKPENTKRATAYEIKRFQQWLDRRGKTCDFATVSANELNDLLRKFYAEVKPVKQGGSLTPSTLCCLRASIHRYVTGAPYSRPFNCIKDPQFTSSNAMFTARCKLFFKSGNKKPQHKPSIGEGDMKKLGEYFANWKCSPDTMIEAMWFYLCFYFGRRGREGWTNMTKNTFAVATDTEGHEYVSTNMTEVTKNDQGGHKQKDIDYEDQRMYGLGVEIFTLFVSKLHPECDRLFQYPLRSYRSDGPGLRKLQYMEKTYFANLLQNFFINILY